MGIKEFIFKYRGQLPIPLALMLIYSAEPQPTGAGIGLLIILLGEWVRLSALRSIGAPSRTRTAGAPNLITWGMYAHVRNPLYVGNFLIYIGLVVLGGGPWLPLLLALTVAYFIFQYALIIRLEESVLAEKFGEPYSAYCQEVPRVIPRLGSGSYRKADIVRRPWLKTIKIEKSSLFSLSVIILALVLKVLLF